ncbi:YdgA family protein [Chitinilyticum litopenaei]|uniref:YdgA family protein n=1 Tax=Chitinilyticum litopenaei TaxID=1121276 RepID=UPI00040E5312|nr:YdgA family protein [Chitinilyticum litopenaei]
MNKLVLGVAGAALLAGGGYVGAAWYAGQKIDGAVERNAELLKKYPIIKVVKRDFQKGLFTSVENVTYRIGCDGVEGASLPGELGTVTLRNTISHHPFAPSMSTEIIYDAKTKAELAKIFKDKEPLQIVTKFALSGAYETTISSPALTYEDPQGKLNWKGLTATIKSDEALSFFDATLKVPGVELATPDNQNISMGELSFEQQAKRSAEGLYVGTSGMSLASLDMNFKDEATPLAIKLGKTELTGESKVTGGLMSGSAKGGIASVQLNGKDIGSMTLKYNLDNLDAAALKQYNDRFWTQGPLQCKSDPMADLQAMQQLLLALLKKDPKLGYEFALKTPEGDSSLALNVASKGLKEEDLANPQAMLPKIDASLAVQVPGALIERVIRETNPAEEAEMALAMFQGSLEQIVAQGFVQNDGKLIKSNFTIKGGQMQLNGQPFDPSMLMGM